MRYKLFELSKSIVRGFFTTESFSSSRVSERVIYDYERITNVSSLRCVDSAEKILDIGWSVSGGPAVYVKAGSIDWLNSESEKRSWACALHCWNMMDVLLAAYSDTRNRSYILPCIEVACEWAKIHKEGNGVSEFSWYDMAVGLRSYRLAFLIDAARQARLLTRYQSNLLWDCLIKHVVFLEDDKNITSHNNHGYYQVAGQLAVGRRCGNFSPAFSKAYSLGFARFNKMISMHFTSEGVHKEHSPDYHRMVYETLKGLIKAGLITDDAVIKKAIDIEKALAWFVYPDGKLVNFGDTPGRSLIRSPDEAKTKWLSPEMLYISSAREIGTAFENEMQCFPESGYWIVKSKNSKLSESISYLAFNGAFHSRTHKHADDLSFVLFDCGLPILVDAGRYGYKGKAEKNSELWLDGFWYSHPARVYCESTRAHNTLEFDGLNFPRRNAHPYGSALKQWGQEGNIYFCHAMCKQFDSIYFARTIIYSPGRWLWIFDQFEDANDKHHNVKQFFNVSPLHSVITQNGGFLISLCEGKGFISVSCSEGIASKVFMGETEPSMLGWHSANDGEIVPAPAFYFSTIDSTSISTLFSFSQDSTILGKELYLKNNEPILRLSWSDKTSIHKMDFDFSSCTLISYSCSAC